MLECFKKLKFINKEGIKHNIITLIYIKKKNFEHSSTFEPN